MARSLPGFAGHLRRIFQAKEVAALSDGVLLDRFVGEHDEAAFEVLVLRHAPLVLGVCRRLLRDEQEAEDAFQATFLALVRKAGSIARGEAVGSWLYKVAYRIALRCRARREAQPRCQGEAELLEAAPAGAEKLRLELDEEINRLPAAYRTAVILCCLEGQTQEAAARQLGCAPSTVAWRLAQARQRLRARLGCGDPDSWAGALVAVPSLALIENTVRIGLAFARGQAVPGSAAVALAEGVLLTMMRASNKMNIAAALVLAVGLLGVGSALFAWQGSAQKAANPVVPARPELTADRLALRLPLGEVTRLGVRVVETKARKVPPRRLELSGSLAIPPASLARIHSRLPGEVIEVASLHVGDKVKKGQILAVLWSKDLSEKKSDLIDALVQLELDNAVLARVMRAEGAIPEVVLRNAQRSVQTSRNAVARARRTLLTWRVEEPDVKAVEEEAKRLINAKGKRDADKEKAAGKKWGRVEVRAPFDGVLLEKNVSVGEVVVRDSAAILFQVADLARLTVLASVSEQDLVGLLVLQAHYRPKPIPWQVRLLADREGLPLKSDGLERISPVLDPATHTSTVSGHVDNAKGRLRPGQSVRVTILLPAASGQIVVPTAALVESGGASYVFVQADPHKPIFTQRRVVVVRRGRDVSHIRVQESGKKAAGSGLRAGERVVTEGAVELKAILDDLREEEP
jgi:cobalt-zinc-cadmium efflux system membrane fusion protein